MSKLKDAIYVSNDADGDIIAVNEDTLADNFLYDAIAGSTDCFYDLNLSKGKYILFKAIDVITIEGDTHEKI